MSAYLERIFKIIEILPVNKNGISVCEIKEKLDSDNLRVTPRTIQRDLSHLSNHFYNDIDCFEDSSIHKLRWFKKKVISL